MFATRLKPDSAVGPGPRTPELRTFCNLPLWMVQRTVVSRTRMSPGRGHCRSRQAAGALSVAMEPYSGASRLASRTDQRTEQTAQPCRKPGWPDEIDLSNFCTLSTLLDFWRGLAVSPVCGPAGDILEWRALVPIHSRYKVPQRHLLFFQFLSTIGNSASRPAYSEGAARFGVATNGISGFMIKDSSTPQAITPMDSRKVTFQFPSRSIR